ncbi:hypothetical protein CU669_07145 [Paramagnetospirillum kuznetsovii]|uniref:Uncharacterized protein n=1 Tax=Paramagnetospirillum kuznetsovii TaxID=2053833 RepID=A0A364NZF8_9PROT|nr:hypothetical protein CU669_07145 [Paramagnetospirillum kuznetsovii]
MGTEAIAIGWLEAAIDDMAVDPSGGRIQTAVLPDQTGEPQVGQEGMLHGGSPALCGLLVQP